ncbi:sensor histidine kinase [Xanthomonas maliensis]|uniref:sensor histidine kinase n=1 Tax=Xanthomonas maliensis TaxID=1321368 RepID=UPI0004CF013A|nr:ATP-binding protein [Xanthomonas maliensis]KAB7769939.1 sensor histidine kinase [Xanthomonas maliensis]
MKLLPVLRWLQPPVAASASDQRHAPFLQVLLAAIVLYTAGDIGLFLYVAGVARLLGRVDLLLALVGSMLTAAGAAVGVWQVRRGNAARAVRTYVTATLIGVLITYVRVDIYDLLTNPMPLLALVLAGMVLGRHALWRVFLLLAAAALVGVLAQVIWPVPWRSVRGNVGLAVVTIGAYALITLILDRTIAALRDSLLESEQRRRELEQLNQRLLQEMAERERVQEQLIHTQKMEALGRLAAGVAHDFDNLINVIIGYAQRRDALEGYGEAPLLKTLENIETASRRALTVSRRILNFGRAEPGLPTLFDARVALRDAEPTLRQLFGHEIRLEGIAAGPPLWVRMDRDDLDLVLLNIAANARDAMEGRGVFRIDGELREATVHVRLCDTGPGIAPHLLARVLEPFYTTKPVGKGTGLGLSVVQGIIAAAGGQVTASNAPHGGACLCLQLPLAEAPSHSASR